MNMSMEKLATLWFDDVGEKFDTNEEACIEHFAWLLETMSDEFVESVATEGILDPIVLTDMNGVLGITNGHHRFIVGYILGLTDAPVTIVDEGADWIENYSGKNARMYDFRPLDYTVGPIC